LPPPPPRSKARISVRLNGRPFFFVPSFQFFVVVVEQASPLQQMTVFTAEQILSAVAAEPQPAPTKFARPRSAGFERPVDGGDDEPDGELLKFEDIVRPEAMDVLSNWWCKTKPHIRAHARWVFVEPDGLPQPRQRVRRMVHHFVPEGDHLEARQRIDSERLNKITFKSTNSEFFPEAVKDEAALAEEKKIWLMALGMSHSAVLKKGALELLSEWLEDGASARKQGALTEVLYSLHEFRTARQGATSSGQAFQEKAIAYRGRVQPFNDPFRSAIARPSSAPIAHAVHRKFEAEKRQSHAEMLRLAAESLELQLSGKAPKPNGGRYNLDR